MVKTKQDHIGAMRGLFQGVNGGSAEKNLPASAGGEGLIPGLGRSPGEGNGNPVQNSCLGNLMDRGAHEVAKSQAQLGDYTPTTNRK